MDLDDASNRFQYIDSPDITTTLRLATTHNPRFWVDPTKVGECRSLRTSSSMALFYWRGVDSLLIKLIGRWRSDAMIRPLPPRPVPSCCYGGPLSTHAGGRRLPAPSGNRHHAPTQPNQHNYGLKMGAENSIPVSDSAL